MPRYVGTSSLGRTKNEYCARAVGLTRQEVDSLCATYVSHVTPVMLYYIMYCHYNRFLKSVEKLAINYATKNLMNNDALKQEMNRTGIGSASGSTKSMFHSILVWSYLHGTMQPGVSAPMARGSCSRATSYIA